MTLQDKLSSARSFLEQHNSSVGENGKKVDIDHFEEKLAELGGISEETLKMATWEDIESCGVPRILARKIADQFRMHDGPAPQPEKIIVIDDDPVKQAANMTPNQLVEKYDPEYPDNPFGAKLKEVSEGQRFIVFNNDETVNVPVAQKLLQELRDDYPERASVVVDGDVHDVYAVGDRPNRYAFEHPLRPGQLLRPDGTSEAGCDWSNIPLEVKQLLYVAVKWSGEIHAPTQDEYDIHAYVQGKDYREVAKRYQKAALRFKELSETNQLPQLRIKLGRTSKKTKTQDPFNRGHRVW
jgi:hypothetical protein